MRATGLHPPTHTHTLHIELNCVVSICHPHGWHITKHTLIHVWSKFKEAKEGSTLFPPSKQLAMFSHTARYISTAVLIQCLWMTHHIPRSVRTCMRTDGWKSGSSSPAVQLQRSSWVKHIPNLSVSFCWWKRTMHSSGETSEIRYDISCTKTLHAHEPL